LGFELDGVKRLRILAKSVGVGVGKDLRSVKSLDHAAFATRVTGEPGVSGRVDVARYYGVAHGKA